MAIKPIIFSTPMVRAILNGSKTMTRRVIKLRPNEDAHESDSGDTLHAVLTKGGTSYEREIKPRYQPGDILWVRERYRLTDFEHIDGDWNASVQFADGELGERFHNLSDNERIGWRPSIHMPRRAARLFPRVTEVRVERLQEITESDALSEGVPDALEGNVGDEIYCPTCKGNGLVGAAHPVTLGYYDTECSGCDTAVKRFRNLWDSINAKRGYPWESNPWVWVITFERIALEEG